MTTENVNRPSLLVLIRHGESVRNKIKKGAVYFADEFARRDIEGIPDQEIPLSEEGWRQAREIGPKLRERFGAPDYAYHSGYLRTMQTMEGALQAYAAEERALIKERMNLFIRERDPGYAYDMTKEEGEDAFPFLDHYWKMFGGFFAQPIGGESLAKVTERVYLFLNMLFRDRGGKKVFVFTHGGTIRCFRFLLEHWNYDQALKWPPGQSPKNCGVTAYRCDPNDGRLVLEDYNTVYWHPPTSP